MSQFLPETPATQPVLGPDVSAQQADTTLADLALMKKLFTSAAKNPSQIPESFMAYIVDYLGINQPLIPISQVVGYKAQSTITGNIPTLGTTPTSGNGFTYTHVNGSGVYVFTFTDVPPPFVEAPVVQVTKTDTSLIGVSVTAVTATGFTMQAIDIGSGVGDLPFNFTAQAAS